MAPLFNKLLSRHKCVEHVTKYNSYIDYYNYYKYKFYKRCLQ